MREHLDERKQRILKAVVQEHVETAEPVGSEALLLHYDFGVRSATIRSEMAELAELGYLRQPHTSAGRVPSDMGYRFYVDRLMGPSSLLQLEAEKARQALTSVATELDKVLTETCRILSGLTRYTSIATPPTVGETVICHISLSSLTRRKLLFVLVLSDGRVEHRMVDLTSPLTEQDIALAGKALASQFMGCGIGEARNASPEISIPVSPSAAGVYASLVKMLKQVLETLAAPKNDVYVEGTNCVVRQPEFKDLAKLETVLNALEERTRLYQLLSRVVLGPDVTVIIGSENPYNEMQDTSFIGARYKIDGKVVGTIGVLGPTRMDYSRAVAAVDLMARNLSELLTELSVI